MKEDKPLTLDAMYNKCPQLDCDVFFDVSKMTHITDEYIAQLLLESSRRGSE